MLVGNKDMSDYLTIILAAAAYNYTVVAFLQEDMIWLAKLSLTVQVCALGVLPFLTNIHISITSTNFKADCHKSNLC